MSENSITAVTKNGNYFYIIIDHDDEDYGYSEEYDDENEDFIENDENSEPV